MTNDEEILSVAGPDELGGWLAENHGSSSAVWLKIATKSSAYGSVISPEVIDTVLCYGWIDSQRKSWDEDFFIQRISRRSPRGFWSKVIVRKVEAFIEARRMAAPGMEEVDAAMVDGRWESAYESQKEAKVPPDLADALDSNPEAKQTFELPGKTVLPLAR